MSPARAQNFYARVLQTMVENNLPFMVGGAYALQEYTGVHRPTKDFDIFCIEEEYPAILKTLSEAGFETELTDSHWLVKVNEGNDFVDFIFSDPGGLYKVNKSWLRHARSGKVFDMDVRLMPVEEMLMSKMYRQKRDHFDGPDVLHLILKQHERLDWRRIMSGMSPHWQLVLEHIMAFWFVYPSEKDAIPRWVIEDLLQKVKQEMIAKPIGEKISRGLLLAPNSNDYEIDFTEWGFIPIKSKK